MNELIKRELYIDVNNSKQRLIIQTKDESLPVLLILHGLATPTSIFAEYYNEKISAFISNFTIVHWDQRGTGASYYVSLTANTMTQSQFVEDTHLVISFLKEKYSKEKVHILAQSWGSIIGLRYLKKYPEDVESYIGEGQATNYPHFIQCMYDYAKLKANEKHHLRAMHAINSLHIPDVSTDPKVAVKFYNKVKKWSSHFVLEEYNGCDLTAEFLAALKTSEYYKGISAKVNLLKSMLFTHNSTTEELLTTDLSKEIKSLNVPVYFIMGEKDFLLPATSDFYAQLNCLSKELIIVKDAGHVPSLDQTQVFENEVSRIWNL